MDFDTVFVVQPESAIILTRAGQAVRIADVLKAGSTGSAVAAARDEGEYATVARLEMAHSRADFFNNTRTLVSQHDRHREVGLPEHYVVVGGADARGTDSHANLARFRRNLFKLLDGHPLVRSVEHRCPNHRCCSVGTMKPIYGVLQVHRAESAGCDCGPLPNATWSVARKSS